MDDGSAAEPGEQARQESMNQTRKTRSDHQKSEIERAEQMLKVGFADRSRMFDEHLFP
jgi:hypothetical protein